MSFAVLLTRVSLGHKVTISRFDIEQDRTLQSDIQLSLDTDLGVIATSLCSGLFYDAGVLDINRCIAMSLNTLRDHKVGILRDSLAAAGASIENEAVSLALQYAYDERYNINNNADVADRLCIVGFPSLDAMLLMTNSAHAYEMLFFLPYPSTGQEESLYSDLRRHYTTFAAAGNRTVQFIHGDALQSITLLQSASRTRLCDMMHIQSTDYSTTLDVQDLVIAGSVGVVRTGDRPLPPVRVVWVRNVDLTVDLLESPLITIDGQEYASYASTEAFSSVHSVRKMNARARAQSCSDERSCASTTTINVLQWQLSSLWMDTCRIDAVSNYDGFTGRTYSYRAHRIAHLQEVLIGRLLPDSSITIAMSGKGSAATTLTVDNMKDVIIAITYTIRVFGETASGLRAALEALGYHQVYIVPDMTMPALEYLAGLCVGTSDSSAESTQLATQCTVLQIALGPHDISLLSADYIAFQMEQVWSPIAFAGPYKLRYALVLGAARCILSYSPLHAGLLRDLGYPCVHVVPLYSQYADNTSKVYSAGISTSSSALQTETAATDGGKKDVPSYDYDFIFFGGCSERRRQVLQQMEAVFPLCRSQQERDAAILSRINNRDGGDSDSISCFSYLMSCVSWNTGVFDNMRHRNVQRGRLVVNIHHDEHSVLEAHRLNYLLAQGKCVVSERSDDLLLDAQYERAVRFVDDNVSMFATIMSLLGNGSALRECEGQARLMYAELSADVGELGRAISHALENC